MNEYACLRPSENEDEEHSVDDASFVTARENLTIDRYSDIGTQGFYIDLPSNVFIVFARGTFGVPGQNRLDFIAI